MPLPLPKWDLSDDEALNMCKWVCQQQNNKHIPDAVIAAVELAKAKNKIEDENNEEYKQDMDPNSIPLPSHLPPLFEILARHTPQQYMRQVILATAPQLGALATDRRFYQNGDIHAFSFMSLLIGLQASNQSIIRQPIDLLLTPIKEQDRIAVEKDNQYMDDKESLKNSEKQPKNEHVAIRKVPVNVSERELIDNLYDGGGKALVGYDTEVDTFVTASSKKWNVQKEIYKKSFHLEEHGTCYKNSRKVQVEVFFNWTATCTPYALPRFIDQNDMQGGLATRLIISEMPEEWGQKQTKKTPYSEEEKNEIIAIARHLTEKKGFIYCQPLEDWFDRWQDEKIEMYNQTQLRCVDILRKRSGVIGYRYGMLIADLLDIPMEQPNITYTEEQQRLIGIAIEWAQFFADSTFYGQMKYFGDDIEKHAHYNTPSSASIKYAQGRQVQRLYASLPDEFTKQQLIAKRVENGESPVVKTIVSRWVSQGLITKGEKDTYKKCVT